MAIVTFTTLWKFNLPSLAVFFAKLLEI